MLQPVTLLLPSTAQRFFTVSPGYLDTTSPALFYPEENTVTFTRAGEVKQPAFVAESASGDFLVLWGKTSSYINANTKDQHDCVKSWEQSVSYSDWDENIISVDEATGMITPKSVGETTLTATFMGLSATVKIVVETV
jgi:hypothetical protein